MNEKQPQTENVLSPMLTRQRGMTYEKTKKASELDKAQNEGEQSKMTSDTMMERMWGPRGGVGMQVYVGWKLS